MGVLDFFGKEAGQRRTKALNDLARSAEYYIPPELRSRLGLLSDMTPSETVGRASQASERMFDADRSAMQRVGDFGTMASEIAGVVAPAVVAGRAGMPAAEALQEGILGFSMSPQAVAARNFAADEAGAVGPTQSGIKAYQGSPHNFAAERLVQMPDGTTEYIVGAPDVLPDVPAGATVLQDFPLGRMRMDKIGTGEGAQAYGHGLYAAENEGVARGYRDALSLDAGFSYKGKDGLTRDQLAEAIEADFGRGYLDNVSTPRGVADSVMDELIYGTSSRKLGPERTALRDNLRQSIGRTDPGSMYEVNINANPEDFLDYDAPLSAQPEAVRRFASERWQQVMGREPDPTIEGEYIAKMASPQHGIDGREWLDTGPAEDQARRLREAGIPGIRYRDAGSRGMDGEPTRNYVVFDENLISIVRKYGIAGAAAILGVSALDVEQAMAQGAPQPQGLLGGVQ